MPSPTSRDAGFYYAHPQNTLVFPNQFTAEKKVLVFYKNDRAKEALDASATYTEADEYIQKVKDGWLDFDIAIAISAVI